MKTKEVNGGSTQLSFKDTKTKEHEAASNCVSKVSASSVHVAREVSGKSLTAGDVTILRVYC